MRIYRAHIAKLVSMVLLITLLVTILSPGRSASAQEREPNPGDYFLHELLAGIGGAFAGGVAAGLTVEKMVAPKDQTEEEDVVVVTVVGLGTGLAIGATAGVIIAGSLLGVNGNLLFAPLGGVFGVINAFGVIYWQEIEEGRELGLLVRTALAVGAPAFGAATGYNIGAKIRTKGTDQSSESVKKSNNAVSTGMESDFVLPLFEIDF